MEENETLGYQEIVNRDSRNTSLTVALEKASTILGKMDLRICYLGDDAAVELGRFARELDSHACMVLCDPRTLEAAGETVLHKLTGRYVKLLCLDVEPLQASLDLAQKVLVSAEGHDLIVVIGSGTLCDLGKYAGNASGKPVLVFPTAPSMNGYTSGIVALSVQGLKQTIPVRPVTGVFADPEVLAKAPSRMVAAGFADFVSKTSASADWMIAHTLRHEPYMPEAFSFYEAIYEEVLSSAEMVGKGDPIAIAKVTEALLKSGLSMLVAGASSPASGGEHLISHYLDMKSALDNTPHDLHGAQVGVATIHTLAFWERITQTDFETLDPEKLADSQPTEQEIEHLIRVDWHKIAPTVLKQWNTKKRSRQELVKELQRLKECHEEILKPIQMTLERPTRIAEAIRLAGGPTDPADLTIPTDLFDRAVRNARYLRNRFTVLDLKAHLCINT